MTSSRNLLKQAAFAIMVVIAVTTLFRCVKDSPFTANNPRDRDGTNWNPPVVTFAGGTDLISVAINDSVRFHAAGSDGNGRVTGYLWSSDAGRTFNADDSVFTHLFGMAGRCTVLVKAVDNDSVISAPDTQFVLVHVYPPSVRIAPRDTTIRQGDSLRFTALAKDTNDASFGFVWTDTALHFGDTTHLHADSTDSRQFTFTRNKLYSIAVIAIDAHGQVSRPDTAHVLVLGDAPVITSPVDSAVISTPTAQITWVRGFFRHHQRVVIDSGAAIRAVVKDTSLDSAATAFIFRPDNGRAYHVKVVGYTSAGDSAVSAAVAFSTPAETPMSNARLRSISLSVGVLAPSFNKTVYVYADTVDSNVQSAYVYATPDTAGALVIVNNQYHVGTGAASENVSLSYGANVVPVVVTAMDGVTQRIYTVTVWRKGGGNANLSSLSSSQLTLTPTFNKDSLLYRDTLGTGVSPVSIDFSTSDYYATVKFNGTTQGFTPVSVPLLSAFDTIRIEVTAQNKVTKKMYTIITYRRPDTTADLSNIVTLTGFFGPTFNKDTMNYHDTMSYYDSLYSFTASTYASTTTFTVNDSVAQSGVVYDSIRLHQGVNTITIRTTAQDTAYHKSYVIRVFRYGPDTSAYLTGLTSPTYTMRPTFSQDTLSYRDTVLFAAAQYTVTPTAGASSMRITVNDSVVVSGSVSRPAALAVGANTVTVKVTAQDTSKHRVYTVRVTRRAPSVNTYLDSIVLSAGALTPAVDTSVTSYSAYVPNAISSITVKPWLRDTTGRAKVNNVAVTNGTQSGAITLAVGNTTIFVKVTAQDLATTRTCTLTVERGAPPNEISGIYLTTGTQTLTKALSPYHVTGAIVVGPNGTLIIEPGVVMLMDPGVAIDVQGTLIAQGTASDSIYFRAYNAMSGKWGYVNYASTAVGTTFDGSYNYTGGCILEYCVVENGGNTGAKAGMVYSEAMLLVNHCSLRGSGVAGVYGHSSVGIRVNNSNASGCASTGIAATTISRSRITNCIATNNGSGISSSGVITGCTAVGNAAGGISGDTVTDCTSLSNGGCGIAATSQVLRCTSKHNRQAGISLGAQRWITVFMEDCVCDSNSSTGANGAGLLLSGGWDGGSTFVIRNNQIRWNTAVGNGAGIGVLGASPYGTNTVQVVGNTIAFNRAMNYPALWMDLLNVSAGRIDSNTISGNVVSQGPAGSASIFLREQYSIQGNNILGSAAAPYALANGNAQGTPNINATSNYWGPTLTTETAVRALVYDFFKDNTKSIVDLAPVLTSPAPGAPPIP